MKPKQREVEVYEAVRLGLLKIETDGSIWKVAEMRGNRWSGRVTLRPVTRRRAEHNQGQYLQVRRMAGRKRVYCLAHRLVWMHFNGTIPAGAQINHKNGLKKDNRPENLELCTPSQNMKHAFRIGLKSQWGQRNPASKLTDAQVEAMRSIYAAGSTTQAALAAQFGVAIQTVSKIVRGARRPTQAGTTADYTGRRKHNNIRRTERGKFRGV